jgi:DNA-binding MarR family transcriptional regulator
MATSSRTKAARARRVWALMFDFLIGTAPRRTAVLGRFGLTPNDSRALASLRAEAGRTMRSLADEWQCDASNATWIVDRLERAGLAERRAQPNDRRVKLVVLTPKGVRTKAELMEAFYATPPELLELDTRELETLQRALERLIRPTADPSSLRSSG